MLKKLVNECKFKLQIKTEGPLLVKSGYATAHGPDMSPVLTYRNGQEQVFIPGSSLKGVFRSHIEKVIRSVNEELVCLPYEKPNFVNENNRLICPNYSRAFCGNRFELRKKNTVQDDKRNKWKLLNSDLEDKDGNRKDINPIVYHDSCPVCRLFGSTFFIGRISVGDAYLTLTTPPDVKRYVETRDGVGIDRFSGGAAQGALFNLLVVSAGTSFQTDILLRNFEIWQLGAVMLILQDMEDELIRVGSGRSRGLGHIKGAVNQVDIQYLKMNIAGKKADEIWGLGKFLNGDDSYGTRHDDSLMLANAPPEKQKGIRTIQEFTGEALNDLKIRAMNRFVETIPAWSVPKTMCFSNLQFEPEA